jgi:non-heme chloroperoxidase
VNYRRQSIEGGFMKSRTVAGGGGLPLHVVESGRSTGRSILFVHGFSQCSIAWSRQLQSDLGNSYRLVAMDLRGHGRSGKPRDAYGDSKLWADDVRAVIENLALDRPILCGWSYGPLVILDYIRHYGPDRVGGLHFVGGITRIGTPQATALLTEAFLDLVPGFFATDAAESVQSLESLFRLCLVAEPSAADMYLMLGCAVSTPPHVRQAMLSRSLDNDDVLATIHLPVLMTHGLEDAVVRPEAVDEHKASIKHAELHRMQGAGHAPFWEKAEEFNRRLRTFCESC